MLREHYQTIKECGFLSIDLETMTVPPFSKRGIADPARLKARQYAFDPHHLSYFTKSDYGLSVVAEVVSIAVGWINKDSGQFESYLSFIPHHVDDIEVLKELSHDGVWFIAHNAVFDMRLLGAHFGVFAERVWDTLVMSRLLYPELSKHDDAYKLLNVADSVGCEYPDMLNRLKNERKEIGDVVLRYIEWDRYVTDEPAESWLKRQAAFYSKMKNDPQGRDFFEYMVWDIRLPIEIYLAQQRYRDEFNKRVHAEQYAERGLSTADVLIDYECRAMRIYCQMAGMGIKVNKGWLDSELERVRKIREEKCAWLAERGVKNVGSNQQCIAYVYGRLRIPEPDRSIPDNAVFFTSNGGLSANTDALMVLYNENKDKPDIAEGILNLTIAKLAQQKETLIESLLAAACLTGRAHSMIVPGARTGRRTSSHPNMQNIKMGYDQSNPAEALIKGMAGAFEGDTELWENDLSRAELNMAIALSNDNSMAAACASGDAHSAFAAVYFGSMFQEADAPTRKMLRSLGKAITFATQYGAGAERVLGSVNLAARMHGIDYRLTIDEVKRILERFRGRFGAITKTKELAQKVGNERGFLFAWDRRIMCLPTDSRGNYQGRLAWNYVCQGGIAEITKRWLVLCQEEFEARGLPARIVLEVHDSLIVDCPKSVLLDVQEILSDSLKKVIPKRLIERTQPHVAWGVEFAGDSNYTKWGYHNASANQNLFTRPS